VPARRSIAHCSVFIGLTPPTLAIDCSPLGAGQTDVIVDRYDRPKAHFRDK